MSLRETWKWASVFTGRDYKKHRKNTDGSIVFVSKKPRKRRDVTSSKSVHEPFLSLVYNYFGNETKGSILFI